LANEFSTFFENCPVLKAESDQRRDSRLALCDLTARTLKFGLGLLGIEVVERM
jgi:arginyl-tRNA synthetase